MFTQKSNKQHDLIVDRIHPWLYLIKDQHVKGLVFPDRFPNQKDY